LPSPLLFGAWFRFSVRTFHVTALVLWVISPLLCDFPYFVISHVMFVLSGLVISWDIPHLIWWFSSRNNRSIRFHRRSGKDWEQNDFCKYLSRLTTKINDFREYPS
jgi:hypothetical protein